MTQGPKKTKDAAHTVGRRAFLAAAATAGGAALTKPQAALAQTQPDVRPATPTVPSAAGAAAETHPPAADSLTVGRTGSDFMVDVFKKLDIEYLAMMPGSSFRGLHESFLNHGANKKPEILTCTHEEIAVAMCHGYAKVEGKPMATMLHGAVGVQHASMAIYNAWCDRVPIMMIGGNTLDSTMRRPGPEWAHSVQDNAAIVRDFLKWDAQPVSLEDFSETLMRGYSLAMTPPFGPVMVVTDSELQEHPIEGKDPPMSRVTVPRPPMGDMGGLIEAAAMLAKASNPVIVADRLVRTQAGMNKLVELAELLQSPVIDRYGRLNFPTMHPLNQTARAGPVIAAADVIICLEVVDPWGVVNQLSDVVHRFSRRTAKADAKVIILRADELLVHANFQDFQRFPNADLTIVGDGETSLPYLVEAVAKAVPAASRAAHQARRAQLEEVSRATRTRLVTEASFGWDASPISVARVHAEVWDLVKGLDWTLTGSDMGFQSWWPQRLWKMEKSYQFAGGSGGYGVGYGAPSSVGAALAHRKHGRFCVNIQSDGDLMCNPGALWTAVNHKIPMLNIMHNNGGYHQEWMHVQRMAARHSRGLDNVHHGNVLPAIDYAKLAQSMGMFAIGPIRDPAELGPALRRAAEVVKAGEPALIDVVSQGR